MEQQTKYGRLTIIGEPFRKYPNKDSKQERTCVVAVCECGNTKEYGLRHLKSNAVTSCGCYRNERIREATCTHALTKTPLYRIWTGIKSRCYNTKVKSYKDYGGRGIAMCDEWKNDFKAFHDWCMANGWKKELQIDREKNSGNYEPSNCRFVKQVINNRNRDFCVMNPTRVMVAKLLHFKHGLNYSEISRLYFVAAHTIRNAITGKTWANGVSN